MTTEMTDRRFREILDSYGSSPAGWPHAERAAMVTHLRSSRNAAAALEEAGRLDTMLGFSVVPEPTMALNMSVLRNAGGLRGRHRLRLWWTGLGLAVTATAGALAGSAAAAAFSPIDLPGYSHAETAFGAVLDQPATGGIE